VNKKQPQHHLPTGVGSNKSKTQAKDTHTAVPEHPALDTGRPMAIGVRRRTATAHIAPGLILILAITARPPVEDVAGVETHWRIRHHFNLAKTLDFLTEHVKGSR